MGRADSHLITLPRRGSGLVLRVDYARWGQTPEDLRHLALSAPHARTRERALALFDITQHRCATRVAVRTGRRDPPRLKWSALRYGSDEPKKDGSHVEEETQARRDRVQAAPGGCAGRAGHAGGRCGALDRRHRGHVLSL